LTGRGNVPDANEHYITRVSDTTGLDQISEALIVLNATRRLKMENEFGPKTKKNCSQCGTVKMREEFYKWNRGYDGRQTVCKECSKLNRKKQIARNKGEHVVYNRAYKEAKKAGHRTDLKKVIEEKKRLKESIGDSVAKTVKAGGDPLGIIKSPEYLKELEEMENKNDE
jgi:hypothetical protein